jgi:hypothetical protein
VFCIDETSAKGFLNTGIRIFNEKHKVIEYKPKNAPVIMCFKCNGYNHLAANCTRAERCMVCGEEGHNRKGCPNQSSPKCANCGGSHTANWPDCPVTQQQREIGVARTKTYAEAASKPSSEAEVLRLACTLVDVCTTVIRWVLPDIKKDKDKDEQLFKSTVANVAEIVSRNYRTRVSTTTLSTLWSRNVQKKVAEQKKEERQKQGQAGNSTTALTALAASDNRPGSNAAPTDRQAAVAHREVVTKNK